MPESQNTRVTLAAAAAFARLSGDYNTLHLDAVVARRTAVGEPVAHGMHLAFAALEEVAKRWGEPCRLKDLQVRFARPVPVAATLALDTLTIAEQQFEASLGDGACHVTGSWQTAEGAALPTPPSPPLSSDRLARRPSFDEAAHAAGAHPVYLDRDELARLFPQVALRLPALQTAQILATTRLIAMECPGRNTLFDSLDLHFDVVDRRDDAALRYRASRADARFSLIELDVAGAGVAGRLRTFYHPDPAVQLSFAEAQARVTPHEFANQRALVLGGSRGVGEATAKLVAAGGGSVRLTYCQGEADARRVVDEIASGGGDVAAFHLDVTGDVAAALLRGLGVWRPTHIYYCATPRHSPPRSDSELSPHILDRFRACYEQGLRHVIAHFSHAPPMTVLFPSAAFVESPRPNLRECALAKAEAEAACRALAAALPSWSFHTPRWPPLGTDQNVVLGPVRLAKPADVVLAALRGVALNSQPNCKEE